MLANSLLISAAKNAQACESAIVVRTQRNDRDDDMCHTYLNQFDFTASTHYAITKHKKDFMKCAMILVGC
jgi:hypothetical protein